MWRIKITEEKFLDPKNKMATQVQEAYEKPEPKRSEKKNAHYVLELKIKNRMKKGYWKLEAGKLKSSMKAA